MTRTRLYIIAFAVALVGVVILSRFGGVVVPMPAAVEMQDGLPVITRGIVKLGPNDEKSFYAVGRITLHNFNVGYCLNVAPSGTFNMTHTGGGRIVYIEAKSGKRELATVRSKPRAECD